MLSWGFQKIYKTLLKGSFRFLLWCGQTISYLKLTDLGWFCTYFSIFVLLWLNYFIFYGWFFIQGHFFNTFESPMWYLDLGNLISYLQATPYENICTAMDKNFFNQERSFDKACIGCILSKLFAIPPQDVGTWREQRWLRIYDSVHLFAGDHLYKYMSWGVSNWHSIPSRSSLFVWCEGINWTYAVYLVFFWFLFIWVWFIKSFLWFILLGFLNKLGEWVWMDLLTWGDLSFIKFYVPYLGLWNYCGWEQWLFFNLFCLLLYYFLSSTLLRVKIKLFFIFLALIVYWGFLYNFDGIMFLLLLTELMLILVILLVFLRLDLIYKTQVLSFKSFIWGLGFANIYFFFSFFYIYHFYSITFFNYYSAKEYIVASDFFSFFNFLFLDYSFLVVYIALLLGLFSIFFIFIFFILKFYSLILNKKRYACFFLRRQALIKQANYSISLRSFQKK